MLHVLPPSRMVIATVLTLQSNLTTMGTYEEAVAELEAWQAQRSARLAEFAAVEVRPSSNMGIREVLGRLSHSPGSLLHRCIIAGEVGTDRISA